MKRHVECLMMSVLAVSGCGAESEDSEHVRSEGQALGIAVTGSDAVTQPGRQTESAMAFAAYGIGMPDHWADEMHYLITYNDFTEIEKTVQNGCVYPGTSLMGWSKSFSTVPQQIADAWTYKGRVTPSSSYPILWGDPAITNSRARQWYFYMSNLAVPSSDPQLQNFGCVSSLGSALAGACIARSKDNGDNFEIAQCLDDQGHFYDGADMASSNEGEIYAAYRDVDAGEIDVWRAGDEEAPFVQLPNPFVNHTMVSHPRIRVDYRTGFLYVAAVENLGGGAKRLLLSMFRDGGWSAPESMPKLIDDQPLVDLHAVGVLRTGPQFSFDIGTPSMDTNGNYRPDDVRVLYTIRTGAGKLAVRGAMCDRDLKQCTDAPEWTSETNGGQFGHRGEQFNPNVAAFPGFLPWYQPEWKSTYLSTEDEPELGYVSVQQANLAYFGNARIYLPAQAVPPQQPCIGTISGAYWSDYDDLQIAYVAPNQSAVFIQSFPDSTSAPCYDVSATSAKPQHTSVVKFD